MELIDKYREEFGGVEPICRVLQFAPSTYYAAISRPPSRRALRDEWLKGEILRVYTENYQVYGARKIWRQLHREGIAVARCTVERLMADLGIAGVTRDAHKQPTTVADPDRPVPPDLLNRDFSAPAPNARWVADITEFWIKGGKVGAAFVIDCFSRYIAGWKLAGHMRTDLPLDALKMALSLRNIDDGRLVHHSDHGSQYLSIRYTATLSAAGADCSAGSIGDSYDNALAETVIGLYKTELVRRHGPWLNLEHIEMATLNYVDWWNSRRLHSWCNHLPPAEYEAIYAAGPTGD